MNAPSATTRLSELMRVPAHKSIGAGSLCGVYVIKHKGTAVYVGYTGELPRVRIQNHINNKKSPVSLCVKKYGKDEFSVDWYEFNDYVDAQHFEHNMIKLEQPIFNRYGHNQYQKGIGYSTGKE